MFSILKWLTWTARKTSIPEWITYTLRLVFVFHRISLIILCCLMCYSMKKCSTVPSQKRTCPEKRQRDSSGGENGHREGRRQTEVWSPVGAITEGESSSIRHIPDPIPRYLADVQESGSLLLDCGRSRSVKGTPISQWLSFDHLSKLQ